MNAQGPGSRSLWGRSNFFRQRVTWLLIAFAVVGIPVCLVALDPIVTLSPVVELPAPQSPLPYELNGRRYRNCIEMKSNGQLHFIVLEGVGSPAPTEAFRDACFRKLRALTRNKTLRVEVHRRDEYQREYGRVFVDGVDVNQLLISSGFGWYNGDQVKDAEAFRLAEQQARSLGLGIWGDARKN